MLLTKIEIKNFKSFGNNLQAIEFNPEVGELILLTGENGSGKSSFKEAIEFALYGKVKKKMGEGTVSKVHLPNMYNKNLHVGAEFYGIDSKRTFIRVERDLKPDRLEMWEDHVPYDRIGKKNIDTKIEEYVGLDYKSFLSFISMSTNDFKNFMSLEAADKRLLLDRLFNLNIINELKKILSGLSSQNQLMLDGYYKEISNYDREINGLKLSIDTLKSKVKKNLDEEIKGIKDLMLTKKDEFLKFEEKVQKLEEKRIQLNSMYEQEKQQLQNTIYEIKSVTEHIELYENGKCPTCHTDLSTETFQAYKIELEEKKTTLESIRDTIKETISQYDEIESQLKKKERSTTESYNSIRYYLTDLKNKLTSLKKEKSNFDESSDVNGVQEFLKLIDEAAVRKDNTEELSMKLEKKKNLYKQLEKVLGDNGVKKIIIANLVKVINVYIKESLDLIKFPYQIMLNDQFDAVVTFLGEERDPEILSTGEARKVNLTIMLAYLKIIRSKKRINMLFLDEVFASIDLKSIEDILKIFKNFAQEYKTVVFLVHHAQVGVQWFDRVINVYKNVTTMLEEKFTVTNKLNDEVIYNEN